MVHTSMFTSAERNCCCCNVSTDSGWQRLAWKCSLQLVDDVGRD